MSFFVFGNTLDVCPLLKMLEFNLLVICHIWERFKPILRQKNIVNSFSPIFSFWHTMCAIFYCFQICIKSCAKAPVSFTRLNETPIRHACLKTTTKRSIVRWPRRDVIDPYPDLTKRKLFEHALACRLKQLKCDQRFRKYINVCHWGMRTINRVPWSRKLAFLRLPSNAKRAKDCGHDREKISPAP